MKSLTFSSFRKKSDKTFRFICAQNSAETVFAAQKQQTAAIPDLYHRQDDEPDFDCDFLKDTNILQRQNNRAPMGTSTFRSL
ncbi:MULTISPECIES: hypothetical protein [Flavobacterium]|uniref:hypothetical protein n=1 Tax=Flavobacterium TaxID=237 RepID=UPI0011843FA2|nr:MULTISPECIES: hypothetical protein [Flavobacterium]MCR4032119.1 hypothetical protein [Flavobacterium panacis]